MNTYEITIARNVSFACMAEMFYLFFEVESKCIISVGEYWDMDVKNNKTLIGLDVINTEEECYKTLLRFHCGLDLPGWRVIIPQIPAKFE